MATDRRQRDIEYSSATLPRGTLARSVFDRHLVRLSDRGGASQLIGAAWSDVVAAELERWAGGPVPGAAHRLAGSVVEAIYRLDTLPGVAARASRAGLKNPDFIVLGTRGEQPIVFAVDAKFSIETAQPLQVGAETTAQLFDADEHLTRLLPELRPGTAWVDGLFFSPDYSLTHAMFRHKMGHRRLTVSPRDVVLSDAPPRELFEGIADPAMIDRLVRIDALPFDVWGSLLASQYYFRLERAIVGLVLDARRPLLGELDGQETGPDLLERLEQRAAGAESAWEMILAWDRDVDIVRRQRQAIHQVIGLPISNAELRDLTDRIMDARDPQARPSRNQVRKALGGRFMTDVVRESGTIVPPVADFSAELERIASIARQVGERYAASMETIVEGIIDDLATRSARQP